MQWSPQQVEAIKKATAWVKDRKAPKIFYVAGYAGTGKTTIAKEIAGSVKGTVLFGAFTGKAASVMKRKGCTDATTIHSMIYRPKGKRRENPEFELNPSSAVSNANLVIIDECSMVDEELGADLMSFDKKVLVIGDPAQLPPVKGGGYFTNRTPDMMLTEVHRQARDNPIIQLSMRVREGKILERGTYGESKLVLRSELNGDDVMNADQILVGRNNTRHRYNQRVRDNLKYKGMPSPGEKLVCLRNASKLSLLNGTLWTVLSCKEDGYYYELRIKSLDDEADTTPREVRVHKYFFTGSEATVPWELLKGTQQFTYGYALTCHKAQGSQWDNVCIFDEGGCFGEDAIRWRYTALTRAAEKLTMVL